MKLTRPNHAPAMSLFFLAKMLFPLLLPPPHDFVILTGGSVFFLVVMAALAFLPTAELAALRPPLFFSRLSLFKHLCSSVGLSASSLLVSAVPCLPLLLPSLLLRLSFCSRYTVPSSILPSVSNLLANLDGMILFLYLFY